MLVSLVSLPIAVNTAMATVNLLYGVCNMVHKFDFGSTSPPITSRFGGTQIIIIWVNVLARHLLSNLFHVINEGCLQLTLYEGLVSLERFHSLSPAVLLLDSMS